MNQLNDFIGQDRIKKQAIALINNPPISLLLRGEYGMGKTMLAVILASFLGVFSFSIGKVPEKTGTSVVDEIHLVEEFEPLYNRINRENFIFTTNKASSLPEAFLSRCQVLRLMPYSLRQIKDIIMVHNDINESAALEVAKRSKGNPRRAVKLTERITALCDLQNLPVNTGNTKLVCRKYLDLNEYGLDRIDRTILNQLKSGAKSKRHLMSVASLDSGEFDRRENYLLKNGYMTISRNGRQRI